MSEEPKKTHEPKPGTPIKIDIQRDLLEAEAEKRVKDGEKQ